MAGLTAEEQNAIIQYNSSINSVKDLAQYNKANPDAFVPSGAVANTAISTPIQTTATQQQPSQYNQTLNTQMQDYNSPYNILARQQQMGQDNLQQMEQYLTAGSEATLLAQQAGLQQAHDQQVMQLQADYEQAVADGNMSVREAEAMFNQQKAQIDQQAYLDAENTGLTGQARGIQNSAQFLGLMQGDQARRNTNTTNAMTQRDVQINNIRDRIRSLGSQVNRDITSANSNLAYGLVGAQAQSDSALMAQMSGLINENNNMNRQQGFALDQGALGQQYTMEQMAQAQKDQLALLKKGQEYTYTNRKMEDKYQTRQAKQNQALTLEQFAVQNGYDLAKMDKADKQELNRMAVAQGYTITNATMQQEFTQQNLATEHEFDMQRDYQLNEFASEADYRNFELAQKEAKANAQIEIDKEEALYNKMMERELRGLDPTSDEYKVKQAKFAEAIKVMQAEKIAGAEADASIKYNLGTPMSKPVEPKKSTILSALFPSQKDELDKKYKEEMKEYKKDLKDYEAYKRELDRIKAIASP